MPLVILPVLAYTYNQFIGGILYTYLIFYLKNYLFEDPSTQKRHVLRDILQQIKQHVADLQSHTAPSMFEPPCTYDLQQTDI